MADYWAHYSTRFKNADGTTGNKWTETFPVIGYTDVALVIDTDGTVLTVNALRDRLAEGGDEPDEDGSTWRVTFEVNTCGE